MMYAGKTTVGKALSVISGRQFFDVDQIIEQRFMSINDIFAIYGEKRFRRIEYQVISDVIADNNNCIIAVGGGAFIERDTRALLLETTQSVWLQVKLETVLDRMGNQREGEKRPLSGLINEEFITMRNKIYRQAMFAVDCDDTDPCSISETLALLT